MTDALSIALSGLVAQKQRLGVSAGNIANAATAGRLPESDPSSPASTVYRPLQAQLVAQEGGGVTEIVSERENGISVIFDPQNIYANEEGFIAVPNVDFAEEFVNIIETKSAFKANLAVMKTQDDLLGDLIDALA